MFFAPEIFCRRAPKEVSPASRRTARPLVAATGCLTPTEGETLRNVLSIQETVVHNPELVPRVAQIEERVDALAKAQAGQGAANVIEILRGGRNTEEVEE